MGFWKNLLGLKAAKVLGDARDEAPRRSVPPPPGGGVLDRAGARANPRPVPPAERPAARPPERRPDDPPSAPVATVSLTLVDEGRGGGDLAVDGREFPDALAPFDAFFPAGEFVVRGFGLRGARLVHVSAARVDGSEPFRLVPAGAEGADRTVLFDHDASAPRDRLALRVGADAFQAVASVVGRLRPGGRVACRVRGRAVGQAASGVGTSDAYAYDPSLPFDDLPTYAYFAAMSDLDSPVAPPTTPPAWSAEGPGRDARGALSDAGFPVQPDGSTAEADVAQVAQGVTTVAAATPPAPDAAEYGGVDAMPQVVAPPAGGDYAPSGAYDR